jgi:hypothetical protein
MSYKIEAVVKFNSGEALVLNEKPVIKYERYGSYLFGIDQFGIFVDVYKYETPSGSFVAFAGREFDIPMVDGTFTKANGQWWDAGGDALGKALGSEIISATANTKENLEKCYVFYGYRADKEEYQKLRSTYTGKVFEYREYGAIIKKINGGMK